MQCYLIISSSITGNRILKRKGGIVERQTAGPIWMACVPEPAHNSTFDGKCLFTFFREGGECRGREEKKKER